MRSVLRPFLVLAALAASNPATGQPVYRCTDASGQTTYQQEPCTAGSRSKAVEILPDNGLGRDSTTLEAQWAAAAKQGKVVVGMPRRYVRDAYGAPAEIRPGLSVERASEVWTYRSPGNARRVGFLDGRVAWDRVEEASTAPSPASTSPPPGAIAPADAPARAPMAGADGLMMAARQAIRPGANCASVLAGAGPPDRTDTIRVPPPGSPPGSPGTLPAARHTYATDGSNPPRDVAFTCIGGIVRDVERGVR